MSRGVSSIYKSTSSYAWESGKYNKKKAKDTAKFNSNRKIRLSELQIVDILAKIQASLRNDFQDWDQKFLLSIKEQLVESKKKKLSQKQLAHLRRIIGYNFS